MSATSGVEELDRDRLVWMYEQMLRIREFEERVKRTFVEHPGVIRGHTHLADGAEASIVGSIATLGPEDQFFATYRCHGYPGPWGVEVLSEELRNNPIDVIFRRAYEATAAQFGHERSSA